MFFGCRHGYGRWQAIVDDKEVRVQELICHELNIPYVSLPVFGAQAQVPEVRAQEQGVSIEGSQAQGTNISTLETMAYDSKMQVGGNGLGTNATKETITNRTQVFQDSSLLSNFREMQRKNVEFIKKRVQLLERALSAEYQKEVYVSLSYLLVSGLGLNVNLYGSVTQLSCRMRIF